MFTQVSLTALVATLSFTHFTHAFPALPSTPASPYPNSVLYTWSAEPACANTASQTDCTSAITQICANKDLMQDYDVTVGECTAVYWVDPNDSNPTAATCTAAYTQILDAGIGGALGYDDAGNRTGDPLFVVYPKSEGTGNCFKKTGDTSPVVAANIMPNGQTMGQCTSTSRRALDVLERRQASTTTSPNDGSDTDGAEECIIEDGVWSIACSAICLATVLSTSWITGPFAVAAGLSCFGGCEASGYKLYRNCMTNKGSSPNIFDKRINAPVSANVCLDIQDNFQWQCSAMEGSLLSYHDCASPQLDGVEGTVNF